MDERIDPMGQREQVLPSTSSPLEIKVLRAIPHSYNEIFLTIYIQKFRIFLCKYVGWKLICQAR